MKKIKILLVFTVLFLKANAQMSHLFNFEPVEKISNFVDSIKATFPNNIVVEDSLPNFEVYRITVADSVFKRVSIVYKKFMQGENKDLEIKGTPSIFMVEVFGSYLDLFKIWKTYINKSADKVQLQADGKEYVRMGNYNLHFYKSNDSWSISTVH